MSDGRAYGRVAGEPDPELFQTGAGTPAGELLRRYWHPVALQRGRDRAAARGAAAR